MAQRMLSFVHNRAPRATGLSDKAIDEHKELIRDLYLARKYTRNQVIAHLKTKLNFNISPDQFSRAIRRWGFRKQFHSGKSTQPPNTTASADATTTTLGDDLSSVGTHPALDICTLPCPPEKQPKPRSDLNDIPDIYGDGDITMSSPTEQKSIEPSLSHQSARDLLVSAEYLACCYHYREAFKCYSTISISYYDKMHSAKERRARMLDTARVAKTRRTRELVRLMLETELEMSNDPLDEERHTQCSSEEDEMCRMQSFLFHHHLAKIYGHQNDGATLRQKHRDKARNFTKAFDTHGTESIDLWTLLFFVQYNGYSQIPEEFLDSLQWDFESYGLNIDDCLQYCWEKLNPTKPLHEASMMYDAGQHTRTEPTGMRDIVLENSSLYLWEKSSELFTFLWKEIQLTHGTLPWMSGHPTISPAQILMIVSRMIVKRSCLIPKYPGHVQIRPTGLQIYCDGLLELFHDSWYALDHIKREFATHFVEHYQGFPPSTSKSAVASKPPSQSQDYQIVALESVLASKRDGFTADHLSKTVEEQTTSSKKTSENRQESTDNDLSKWLEEHKGQGVIGRFGKDIYVRRQYPLPTSNSSCLTASISPHRTYLVALNGNPAISRPLASHSSCSSQRSYSSSLQRFKAAGLSLQHKLKSVMFPDVLMDEDVLENLQEDEHETGIWGEWK